MKRSIALLCLGCGLFALVTAGCNTGRFFVMRPEISTCSARCGYVMVDPDLLLKSLDGASLPEGHLTATDGEADFLRLGEGPHTVAIEVDRASRSTTETVTINVASGRAFYLTYEVWDYRQTGGYMSGTSTVTVHEGSWRPLFLDVSANITLLDP